MSTFFVTALLLAVLLAAVVGSAGGSGNGNPFLDVANLPAIQWACEPFLDLPDLNNHDDNNNNNNNKVLRNNRIPNIDGLLRPLQLKTKELCLKVRGGKLGRWNSKAKEASSKATDDENSSNTTTSTTTTLDDLRGQKSAEESITNEESTEDKNATKSVPITNTAVASNGDNNEYRYSVYQKDDGHEDDPDGIPTRYIVMQNSRRDLAKQSLEKTKVWRAEHDVDTILKRPHPKFDVSKSVFPHYFCGRDSEDHVVLLQRPGLLNVKLAKKNDLSGEELLFHYVYVMEYLWRIVENDSPTATMTSIIDLTGLNISILRKREQLRIGSLFLQTMDAHFPQRSHKTMLINAPKWFNALYRLCTPLLRESTKQKIQIFSKGPEQEAMLDDLLEDCPSTNNQISAEAADDDNTLQQYENVSPSEIENEMRNFCLARLDDAGVSMQPVIR